jgi:hypothetical protein
MDKVMVDPEFAPYPTGPMLLAADRLTLLYPEVGSVRRVLALAHVDARRIALDGHAANMWWAATLEATRQGKLAALVAVALEEYPLDPWLHALYGQISAGQPRGSTGEFAA